MYSMRLVGRNLTIWLSVTLYKTKADNHNQSYIKRRGSALANLPARQGGVLKRRCGRDRQLLGLQLIRMQTLLNF